MTVLEVKELTKRYGTGESEVIALDHVSFSVKKGEKRGARGFFGCCSAARAWWR